MSLLSVLCWRLRQSGSLVEDLVSDAPEPVISDSPSDFLSLSSCLSCFFFSRFCLHCHLFICVPLYTPHLLWFPPRWWKTSSKNKALFPQMCWSSSVRDLVTRKDMFYFRRLSSFLAHPSKTFVVKGHVLLVESGNTKPKLILNVWQLYRGWGAVKTLLMDTH